jgi:hypothetical protein
MSTRRGVVREIEALRQQTTTDVKTTARALGCGTTWLYEEIRAGRPPVKVLRLGHKLRVLIHGPGGLLDVLGLDADEGAGAA